MNKLKTNPVIIQLKRIMEGGASLEDACELCDVDIEFAKGFITGDGSLSISEADKNKEISAEDIINKNKAKVAQALVNIALDNDIENISARVAAARIIIEGKGELPEFPVDKLGERYKKMLNVVGKYSSNTITNPSPSTSIVDVKMSEELVAI